MMKSRGVLSCIAVAMSLAGAGCVDELETSTDESEIGGDAMIIEGSRNAVGIVHIRGGICTGTLISDRFVLTASHCVCEDAHPCEKPQTATFELTTVPVFATATRPAYIGSRTFQVIGMYMHPDYEVAVYGQNDVAVLELGQQVSQYVDVQPAALSTVLPQPRDFVTIVGYGQSSADCSVEDYTKRAGETTIQRVVDGGAGDITYFLDGSSVFPCYGDSGGPAFASGPRSIVVGVNVAGAVNAGAGKAVAPYLPWIAMQMVSPGNHVAAFDLNNGGPAGPSIYLDQQPDSQLGWLDPGDVQLTGDFRNTGSDQILYINRAGSTGGSYGLIKIASYADGIAPAEVLYWQAWNSPYHIGFNDFVNTNDKYFVGDFRGLGYDQLLMVNQSGSGPQFKVVDFTGAAPATRYSSTYADDPMVGWHDASDTMIAGNFRGLGHDQLMLINTAGSGGRIVIVDFSDATAPAEWVYFEHHVDGVQLNGWTDPGDLAVAGDYRGLGYDQVLFVNRGAGNGRFLVADFHDGVFPAEWQYYEAYGWSTFLDGFHDSTVDVLLAGDFRGLGFDQAVFVNRNLPSYGRAMVVDFHDGVSPTNPGFVQTSALASPLLARIDPGDTILAGTITGGAVDRLVTIEP